MTNTQQKLVAKYCSNTNCSVSNPQPLSAFSGNRSTKDRLQNQCKLCQRAANRKWSKANPEKNAAKARRLRRELKEKNPQKAWALKRNQRLKAEYGITLEQYNKLFAQQKGCCAICGDHAKDHSKGLVVDHDHLFGHVRALLCGLCNKMLGHCRESETVLEQAIKYLRRH